MVLGFRILQFRWIKWELLLNRFILLFAAEIVFIGLRSEELVKLNLMVDRLGYTLLLLTIFITRLILTGSYSRVKHFLKGEKEFLSFILFMIIILGYTFLEGRFIYFFILF